MLKAENVPINGVEAGDAEDGRGGFATDGAITKAVRTAGGRGERKRLRRRKIAGALHKMLPKP